MKPSPNESRSVLASAGPWIALYLALILLPPALLLVAPTPRPGGFWWDFALGLGYVALAMIGVQFWMTARFKRATAPFGIDLVYYFHRYFGALALSLLLLHVAIFVARYPVVLGGGNPLNLTLPLALGWVALAAFLLMVLGSFGRKWLGIEYDRWRRWHVALALVGLGASVAHVFSIGSFLEPAWKSGLWGALALTWFGLVVWVRVVRPWRLTRAPYRVTEVRREAGNAWTLRLEPEQPGALVYRPGQFAWLTLGASPWAMREHPFSMSSSPTHPGALEFTIKAVGDFTSAIGTIRPGERAYVDAPYGNFVVDPQSDATGFVFVAGGSGIAPILSMLRALADLGEQRPIWLFYGNRRWERVIARDELDALVRRLRLQVVHVLGEPAADWSGERGMVTLDVLRRHLPADLSRCDGFVCGPAPMTREIEQGLARLGVPRRRLHSEIFDIA